MLAIGSAVLWAVVITVAAPADPFLPIELLRERIDPVSVPDDRLIRVLPVRADLFLPS